jgi:hypothetical protein
MMASALTSGLLAENPGGPAARQYIWMRKVYLRNGPENQAAKLAEYLEKAALPAMKRTGAMETGFFTSLLAPDSPFYLIVGSYASLASLETAMNKGAEDSEYAAATKAFHATPGHRYVRYETSVLRGFANWPALIAPKPSENARVFELRTYESDNSSTLAQKIRMFNEGEIAIFRKTGLEPVFFGESIFGARQPQLTYMLWYDDLAAREANWKKFIAHPDWIKLRATPGWSDAEIVSNISSVFLRGLPFSPIR